VIDPSTWVYLLGPWGMVIEIPAQYEGPEPDGVREARHAREEVAQTGSRLDATSPIDAGVPASTWLKGPDCSPPAPGRVYRSDAFGYAVIVPAGWTPEPWKDDATRTTLSAPDPKVVLTVDADRGASRRQFLLGEVDYLQSIGARDLTWDTVVVGRRTWDVLRFVADVDGRPRLGLDALGAGDGRFAWLFWHSAPGSEDADRRSFAEVLSGFRLDAG
jgi:hypothetical protein